LLLTVTCGGDKFGYKEIGKVGMHTAPARIISRAQTVAKIGRLMKKSTKPAHPLSLSFAAGERRNWITFLESRLL
jgi:hypothetical protein